MMMYWFGNYKCEGSCVTIKHSSAHSTFACVQVLHWFVMTFRVSRLPPVWIHPHAQTKCSYVGFLHRVYERQKARGHSYCHFFLSTHFGFRLGNAMYSNAKLHSKWNISILIGVEIIFCSCNVILSKRRKRLHIILSNYYTLSLINVSSNYMEEESIHPFLIPASHHCTTPGLQLYPS